MKNRKVCDLYIEHMFKTIDNVYQNIQQMFVCFLNKIKNFQKLLKLSY